MKIAIFYHIAQMGMGALIYQSQLHRLYASGLISAADYIHFGVNGEEELFNIPEKAIVHYNQKQNWGSEKETLFSLKDFSYKNPDYKILYFHTKGSSFGTLPTQSWRLMMEYFVIDKWKECVEHLNEYDCVGSHSGAMRLDSQGETMIEGANIFMGNFWWANASYINTLRTRYLESNIRETTEFWISDANHSKGLSLYNTNVNGYEYCMNEKDYVR